MARGWESKSVEDQQAESMEAPAKGKRQLTPLELAKRREQDELGLARKDVLRQLEAAQNPRHRKMLEDALAALDARLSQMG
ncbi:MAG: hypothetical protein LAO03_00680 [Acidobacteriia bacterium]|nr:hypothetical protein [Terriglobia bacterium]